MSSQSELSKELQRRPLTKTLMIRLKALSLRRGQWFKVLETQERGLIDVAVSWVNTVRSGQLELVLSRILSKLVDAISSPLAALLGKGRRAAFRISELALGWGNGLAWNWRFDDEFRIYLGARIVGCEAAGQVPSIPLSNR